MAAPSPTRTDFVNRVLPSRLADQVATRFGVAAGEEGARYTLGRNPATGQPSPVVLYVATFPPASPQPGVPNVGLDY